MLFLSEKMVVRTTDLLLAQWRNGQWADPMLAHAGTEAVRLVPFSSLLLSAV